MGGSLARLSSVVVEFPRRDGHHRVLDRFDFVLEDGRTTCLLGPSGIGKSTILNLFAGFLSPLSGSVVINDQTDPAPGPDRGVVFQHHSLFPWMSVRDNIEFGMRTAGVPRQERRARAADIAHEMGVADVLDERPDVLSGGMAQRVGLARVFVNSPGILLLDEPFSSLDAITAEQARDFLRGLLQREPKTTLLVTHNVDEALVLGDRVVALNGPPAKVVLDVHLPPGHDRDRREDQRWLGWRRDLLDALASNHHGKDSLS